MQLKSISLNGFKSFSKKTDLVFDTPITVIVGPNGSGKSNITEGFRFVLGEQSIKSLRGKKGEDFIWNGGSGSESRSNRATITINFDNKDDFFGVGFEDFILQRSVYRDSRNDYSINDTQVRLKDINEVLAKANMGASGHHIISQGQADRILNATPTERREMIEDGIGLKIYQYKRVESEKKLKKTNENIHEVELIKRELRPHIKYLKKQVERIERAKSIAENLELQYLEYLKRQKIRLEHNKKEVDMEAKEINNKLDLLSNRINEIKTTEIGNEGSRLKVDIQENSIRLSKIMMERQEVELSISRAKGEISAYSRMSKVEDNSEVISRSEVVRILDILKERQRSISEYTKEVITAIFGELVEKLTLLVESSLVKTEDPTRDLLSKLSEYEKSLEMKQIEEKKMKMELDSLKDHQEKQTAKTQNEEKELHELFSKRKDCERELDSTRHKQHLLNILQNDFEKELAEGIVLVGDNIKNYMEHNISSNPTQEDIMNEIDEEQVKRGKELERTKIRLEEIGVERDTSVYDEYTKLVEREEFLNTQSLDLQKSVADLEAAIEDLSEEINKKFDEGIKAINEQFSNFFHILFDGGKCSIKTVCIEKFSEDKQENVEQKGLDIDISLPRKKIKELHQLSGGERSLISIALLFALSRVKPQPFLILDETDAALDEANSKRYGDMIELLSEHSKLIIITHNRESMSRAGKIYGVTMSQTGASQLLSIEFDEAVKVAK